MTNKTLSFLKLRASYGQLGNDQIPASSYILTANANIPYVFNGQNVLGNTITQIKDRNLRWETTTEYDAALEFGFLDNRLTGEVTYYDKRTTDALIPIKIPGFFGDPDNQLITNAATITNRGVEAALNWRAAIGTSTDWTYTIGANVTFNTNRIANLNGGQALPGGPLDVTKSDNGVAAGSFFLLDAIGVYQSADEIAKSPKSPYGTGPGGTTIPGDLKYAVDNLPLKGATETGRATKAAAQGLLAKVYLYQKNYQKAFDLTDEIVKGRSGTYGLFRPYADIWRTAGANSVESIFEVQAGINASCDNSAVNLYSVSQGPRAGGLRGWADLGFGFNNPTAALANAYEPNDVRKDGSIIFIKPKGPTVLWDGFRVPGQDSVENSRYSYKAYHSRTKEPNCGNADYLPKNIRILRYAEILLIHAEAAAQLGNAGAAQTDLDAVRSRAGLAPTAPTVANIWKERRVELALEHDRFFDLVRQESVTLGRIVPIFAAQGKTFVKGKHELFPIPQPQIDLSGGLLTQNPGY